MNSGRYYREPALSRCCWNSLRPALFGLVFLTAFCEMVEGAQAYAPQSPDPVLEPWRWQAFPQLNGRGLRCLTEGPDGAIWFGIDNGVLRYDGQAWTSYTREQGLLGEAVNTLCTARSGTIYAGTDHGVSRFDAQTGSWAPVSPMADDFPWNVTALHETRDGAIWAGTAWGALRMNGPEATLYTIQSAANCLRLLVPDLPLSIALVPLAAAPSRAWGTGIGARIIEGFDPLAAVVWTLAPNGPAERAGLQIGDRITAVDKHTLVIQSRIDGQGRGASSSTVLTVARRGSDSVVRVDIQPAGLQGFYQDFPIFDIYEDRDGTMWFAVSGRIHGGEILRWDPRRQEQSWRLYTAKDGLQIGWRPRIIQARSGHIWVASHERMGVNRFDGHQWRSFRLSNAEARGDNLPGESDWLKDTNPTLLEARDGSIWVAAYGAVYQYRDDLWTAYRQPDVPIPASRVVDICETANGWLWFVGRGLEAVRLDLSSSQWSSYRDLTFWCETPGGTQWFISEDRQVISRYGNTWTQFGAQDGVVDHPVRVVVAADGALTAVGKHQSLSATARFDGSQWRRTLYPRLHSGIDARAVYAAPNGDLWLGDHNDGLLRLSGRDVTLFKPFSEAPRAVHGATQTPDGTLWFGGSSLRRFDGHTWSPVLEVRELLHPGLNWIDALHTDSKGHLWIGTRSYGVIRYDGQHWQRFNTQHGLADNAIKAIHQTTDGTLWVATSKGISRFDGETWTAHALPSSLAPVLDNGLHHTQDGSLWINRNRETVRHTPDRIPPDTEITFAPTELSLPGDATFSWKGQDPWRADTELRYSYRLDNDNWSPFSSKSSATISSLTSGSHRFEVRARDVGFNVDGSSATAHFTVFPPVWQRGWFLALLALFLSTTVFLISRIVIRTRDRDRAQRELIQAQEEELQNAHDMQMGLMPARAPQIPGIDMAGHCLPANNVSGDFYQYFERGNTLTVALADVTGHAMKAAIPAVMFSGILENQMETDPDIETLYARLNRSLCRVLDDRTFICLTMGQLNLSTNALRFANAGGLYPYLYRNDTQELIEMQMDAYPLGVAPETRYGTIEAQLHPGDYCVFCSDGLAETQDPQGNQFGFTRLEACVQTTCRNKPDAQTALERILDQIRHFSGDADPADDITCIVLTMTG